MRFELVGSDFKEKSIELCLMIGGICLYHLYLRPKEYFESRKKRKNHTANHRAESTEKAVASN